MLSLKLKREREAILIHGPASKNFLEQGIVPRCDQSQCLDRVGQAALCRRTASAQTLLQGRVRRARADD